MKKLFLFFALAGVVATSSFGYDWYPSVAVIRNVRSVQSRTIADYYVSARFDTVDGIVVGPAVITVDCDTSEEISSAEFNKLRTQVEEGVLRIEAEEPWRGGMEYLVTTKGTPLKVSRSEHFRLNDASASVESELSLILGPYSEKIGGDGYFRNPFYQGGIKWTLWQQFSRARYGVFIVTRLDGYTIGDVFAIIDNGKRYTPVIYSDSPIASVVLDENPDYNQSTWEGGYKFPLNQSISDAADSLAKFSEGQYRVVHDETEEYLVGERDVLAYVSFGSNDLHSLEVTENSKPRNTWLPGSIAETFVSTSARTFSSPPIYGQSLIADLVKEGACGANGYVYEPFGLGVINVKAFLISYLYVGNGFGESVLMATPQSSWMSVVVGDPLMSIRFIRSSVTPVELASFDARVIENRIYLQWTTESESNNLGFEVEMKRGEEQLWQKVAFVKGAGTTNEPRSYSYSEEHDRPGDIEYRLKQIDTNGDFAWSKVIQVTVSAPQEFVLEQNYPNPFNPTTTINYNVARQARVKLVVYNVLGREVATLVDDVKSVGNYSVRFDAANLGTGTYVYRLSAGDQAFTKKMMLLK